MELKWILQVVGVLLGFLYLYLEYKADIRLWVVSLIMPLVHGCLYFNAGLYADAGMQAYYVLAAVYGWVRWRWAKVPSGQSKPISNMPLRSVPVLLACLAAVYALLVWFLLTQTNSTVPYWDALTTALSIIALYMLSEKWVEQWLVWLLTDAITVGLYIYKEIPLTAGLYGVYCVMALAGYFRWKKMADTGK